VPIIAEDGIVDSKKFDFVSHGARITEFGQRTVIAIANGDQFLSRLVLDRCAQVPEKRSIGTVAIPIGCHFATTLAEAGFGNSQRHPTLDAGVDLDTVLYARSVYFSTGNENSA